jgi:hypothetical protein
LASLSLYICNSYIFQGGGSRERGKKRIGKKELCGALAASVGQNGLPKLGPVSPLDLPRQYQTSWQISNIIITAAAATLLLDIRLFSLRAAYTLQKRVCVDELKASTIIIIKREAHQKSSNAYTCSLWVIGGGKNCARKKSNMEPLAAVQVLASSGWRTRRC